MTITMIRKPISTQGLAYDVTEITPEIARAWLDKNVKNRKLSARRVAAFARDIKNNAWRFTGDAIRFDVNGNLLDGQHRLRACIEAGKPFTSLVLYKLPTESRDFIDLGAPRSPADVLMLNGHVNTIKLAAAARTLIMLRSGYHSESGFDRVTTHEIMACLKKHPLLPHSILKCHACLGISTSLLAVVHYIGAVILEKRSRADAFVKVWTTGQPDYDGDPAHILRERLLREKGSATGLKRDERYRLLFHTWNAFAKKKPVELLRPPKELVIDGLDPKSL